MGTRYNCPKCQGMKCVFCNGYGYVALCPSCNGSRCIMCGFNGYILFTTGPTGPHR